MKWLLALLWLIAAPAWADTPVTIACTMQEQGIADADLAAIINDPVTAETYRFEVTGADSNFWTWRQPATCSTTLTLPNGEYRADLTAEAQGHAVGPLAYALFQVADGTVTTLSSPGGVLITPVPPPPVSQPPAPPPPATGPPMSFSVVQTQSNYDSVGGTSPSITLGASPTAGNLLIVAIKNSSGNLSGSPATLTSLDNNSSATQQTNDYYRKVLTGDGTTYTWTLTTFDRSAMGAIEISGQDATTPINQHNGTTGFGTTATTPSLTPSVIGCQPIMVIGVRYGATLTTPTGWTRQAFGSGSSGTLAIYTRDTTTSDTTTAISGSVAMGGSDGWAAQLILVAPASGGGGTTVNATVGSLTWGGLASPLSTQINAGIGGYTWQGKPSPLITTINATIGSYAFSGLSSPLSAQINASAGGYAWGGLSAPLSTQINAAIGTWTWSGKASSIITTPSINATVGTWTWGGQFSPLATQLNAGVGGWTMQGMAATVTTPSVQLSPQLRFGSDREFAAASDRSFGVGSGANWKAKRYGLIN